ncbi:MAG: UDP-N-acetylglucosamine 2-epimerase (non-hydrolyzing) [Ignavibacteria bacterium]|nr:UDP-N-acetylglucosamine 2-epimerase (non-hydrolyzing) [Ignavibacteria bacterium]
MKKILIVFGTRPEVIKMAPLVAALKKEKSFKTFVCSTGQHKEMLKQVSQIFKIKVDYELDLMKPNQDLFDITVATNSKLKNLLEELQPDVLLVQGDTTTAFVSALSAFYKKIKIGHVEAGLRSNNIYSPYPEEANRKFISVITDFNFVPTKYAKDNLISEGYDAKRIFVTGNTVIDALLQIKKLVDTPRIQIVTQNNLKKIYPTDFLSKEFVLITMHRREKFGDEFKKVLDAFKELAAKNPKLEFIYPVHLNPNVKIPVEATLKGLTNFHLLPPMDYLSFIYLMEKCKFIMSDSGGVQEECFVFRKPIIVLRDVTERMEAVDAGYAFLVGSNINKIKKTFHSVNTKLSSGHNYFEGKNPYGDGKASEKIVKLLKKHL